MNNKPSENPKNNSNNHMAIKPGFDHLRIHDDENFVFHSRRISSDNEETNTGIPSLTLSLDDDTIAYGEDATIADNLCINNVETTTDIANPYTKNKSDSPTSITECFSPESCSFEEERS